MRIALVACALVGCAPVVNLPQPSSPFAYEESRSYSSWRAQPSVPEPNGNCLQVTSRRKAGSWLWKNGTYVGSSVDRLLVGATVEDPPANSLAREARRESIAGGVLAGVGFLLLPTAPLTLIGTQTNNGDIPVRSGLIAGAVLGTGMLSFAIGLGLLIHAEKPRHQAVVVYNEWAKTHGCPPPQP